MPLNHDDAATGAGRKLRCRQGRGLRLVGNIIKFPDEGRIVRFGPPPEVVTPATLGQVFGVAARIEPCSRGHHQVLIDGLVA